jgi:hypothetical protein
MDDAPDPADGGTDKALLKIAAHQLEEEAAPFYQITEKQCPRNVHFCFRLNNINLINSLQGKSGVDRTALMLLQFGIRQTE